MNKPKFYDEKNCKWSYNPDIQKVADEAFDFKKANKISSMGSDKEKVHLLLIDVQKDFCFPEGTLYVGGRTGTGAVEDSKKIAQFIYNNVDRLTNITTTLDTHLSYQIFFPWFWLDVNDQPLKAHTVISSADVKSGKYKPNASVVPWLCNGNYSWLVSQCIHYCEQLEKNGKYQLYLWPPHCLLGGEGHPLVGIIHEARMFHSFVRGSESHSEVKGGHPLTENYSVFSPEVLSRHDGQPLTQKNVKFIEKLCEADAMIIAGQAASHCVKSSIDDLLSEILVKDPSLAKKVHILEDCMSSVVVPGVVDFTDEAQKALKKFEAAGMKLVTSNMTMDQILN
jgi:nicotinamidase-related amidase